MQVVNAVRKQRLLAPIKPLSRTPQDGLDVEARHLDESDSTIAPETGNGRPRQAVPRIRKRGWSMQREQIGVVGGFEIAVVADAKTGAIAAYEILDGAGIVKGTFSPAGKYDAFRRLRQLVSSDTGCLARDGVCSVCEQTKMGKAIYVVRIGRKVFSYKCREQAMRFFYQEAARHSYQPTV